MAEKALYILSDNNRLETFKHAALARAKEFDINQIVPIYENFYRDILSKQAK